MEQNRPGVFEVARSEILIVGGGIAGMWIAYKLVRAGIRCLMITEATPDDAFASTVSAGAINLAPVGHEDFGKFLDDLTLNQSNPSVSAVMDRHLAGEVAILAELMDFKEVKIGIAPVSGSGRAVLQRLWNEVAVLGGQIVQATVSKFEMRGNHCVGVQYSHQGRSGKVLCKNLVIASGGYSGLFRSSISKSAKGTVIGQFILAGGVVSNLEFLFRHGFGNIETHSVTPTEQIAGASVYGMTGRVVWLEEDLFYGRGTFTHLAAIKLWMENAHEEYYIDTSYEVLYRALKQVNDSIENRRRKPSTRDNDQERAISELLAVFSEGDWTEADALVRRRWEQQEPLDFADYGQLKEFYKVPVIRRFPVNPATYFSMGGISHHDFQTNFANVFVTGEAMHDFGANRIGGLPWGLYLASGKVIAGKLIDRVNQDFGAWTDFEILCKPFTRDPGIADLIGEILDDCLNQEFSEEKVHNGIHRLVKERQMLDGDPENFHEGSGMLVLAEAILKSALAREETRGHFIRSDFPETNPALAKRFTWARYEKSKNEVIVDLASFREAIFSCRFRIESESGETCGGQCDTQVSMFRGGEESRGL
jgi:fatty acid CoA ligase FadD22